MIEDITLIHIQNGVTFDVSHLVQEIRWSGRTGSSARTLTVKFLDYYGTPFQKMSRVNIQLMEGDSCIFKYKGVELFRGMWMKTQRSDSQMMTATAYDLGIYLANNKDTFVYENPVSATTVFNDVCSRFGIPTGEVAGISYKVDELVENNKTGWDVIEDILETTYDATGIHYAVIAEKGKLNLIERRQNLTQWVLETGVNLTGYSRTMSIEKVRTRIKIYSKEHTVLAEAADASLESKIGRFQDVQNAKNDEMTQAQLNQLAQTTLAESKMPERSMSVTGTGLMWVYAGVGLYVKINSLDSFEQACYVQEDTHTWTGNSYTMSLKIEPCNDLLAGEDTAQQPAAVSAGFAEGSVVNFNGGNHYVSSSATAPSGTNRKAGPAKITKIAKGGAHMYHVVGGAYDTDVSGASNVYGWVDASQVSGL